MANLPIHPNKINKIIHKIKWVLLIERDYLLVITGKERPAFFSITELEIRPNCSDYFWS